MIRALLEEQGFGRRQVVCRKASLGEAAGFYRRCRLSRRTSLFMEG
jgi:hypothetical protein